MGSANMDQIIISVSLSLKRPFSAKFPKKKEKHIILNRCGTAIKVSSHAYNACVLIVRLYASKTWAERVEDVTVLIRNDNTSVLRQKGEFQNGCYKKTKHAKFSKKRTFLTP